MAHIRRNLWDVAVPMRDGVPLSADLYFPANGAEGGPYPAVVMRTPYGKQTPVWTEAAKDLADHGYALVLQDVRGRHDSLGEWVPFRNEGRDGYDTIEWVADQPWCNGRVGTIGGSYGGWQQWALAREHPPHLVTMTSTAPVGAWMEELPFHNGVLMLLVLGWLNLIGGRAQQKPELVENWPEVFRHLPVVEMPEVLGRDIPLWREWLEHPTLDDYWRELRLDDSFGDLDLPVLHVTGWYDADQPGGLFFYNGMRTKSGRASDQHVVIGAWDHGGTRVPQQSFAGVDFGASNVLDIQQLHRDWFDRWLKDIPDGPRLTGAQLFITGRNTWVTTDSYPPSSGCVRVLHLRSGGSANGLTGDGRLEADIGAFNEAPDRFTYDPNDPVPAALDENFYSPDAQPTPLDRRFQHERNDVLVYTSIAEDSEVLLVGHPRVSLFASTDGPDTDWFVALHDVAPDGTSMMLTEGRLRARFKDGLEQERLLVPDEVYEFPIPMGAVGHAVLPGHRIRLTVTSSDFPIWERNLNTGAPIGMTTEIRTARNSVFHDSLRPSALVLPTADEGSLR